MQLREWMTASHLFSHKEALIKCWVWPWFIDVFIYTVQEATIFTDAKSLTFICNRVSSLQLLQALVRSHSRWSLRSPVTLHSLWWRFFWYVNYIVKYFLCLVCNLFCRLFMVRTTQRNFTLQNSLVFASFNSIWACFHNINVRLHLLMSCGAFYDQFFKMIICFLIYIINDLVFQVRNRADGRNRFGKRRQCTDSNTSPNLLIPRICAAILSLFKYLFTID